MSTATAYPTGDEATIGSWSTSPFWSKVDEAITDDGDLITCTALSSGRGRQTFSFTAFSVPAGSTGISITVRTRDKKASSQGANVGAAIRVGGTYYDATGRNPATSFTNYDDSWATNPKSGAAWTVDDVNGVGANALQAFGVTTSDTTPNISCSQCYITVTYTPVTTTYKTVTSTAVGTPLTGRVATMYRAANASAVGSGLVAKAKMFTKVVTGVVVGVSTQSNIVTLYQTIAATAVGVTTTVKIVYLGISTTAQALPLVVKRIYKSIVVVAVGNVVVGATLVLCRSIPAIATATATTTRIATYQVLDTATAIAIGLVSAVKITSGAIPILVTAVAHGVATVSSSLISEIENRVGKVLLIIFRSTI